LTQEIHIGDKSFLQGANIKVQKYQGVKCKSIKNYLLDLPGSD